MQHADLGGGGAVWFVHDSAGNRVRKVRVNHAGTQTEERIYLGGVELYRERQGGVLQLERQTVHIADDAGRICLVETRTVDAGAPVEQPANVARYQYGNHLGSASLELDEAANTISYEEFHPYGTSSYRAVDASIQVTAKRYRYAGKERDEETGLDHMGARYYAPWLGRWTAADPIGLGDGVNRYAYVSGNPIRFVDLAGTRKYEKTSWGSYAVGVNTPLGKQEAKATQAAAFARAEAELLAQLEATGAPESEISLQRETVTELQAEAFQERVVLDLAAGDPGVSQRIAASGMSIGEVLELGARAGAISHAQNKWEERFQAEGAAKRVYMTPDGNFTDAQLTARRQAREFNVVTGPTIGAIAYAGGEGVSLEVAEGIQTAEGAAGALAPVVRHITRRWRAPSAERQTTPVVDQRTTRAAKEGAETTRVGRWMSPDELKAMQESGFVQEGSGGLHRVAVPVDPAAYKAAPKGDVFVTYDVPTSSLVRAGQENWRAIPGPNSMHAKLAAKKGEPIPQLPRFQNLRVEGK
jgi:RHS repeat-associated protein